MRLVRMAVSALLGSAVVLLVGLAAAAHMDVVHLRVVQSSSMEPELSVGDLLVNRVVDAAEAEEGGIATILHPDGHLVTHRVLSNEAGESGGRVIQMQGDDNTQADPVPYEAQTAELTLVRLPLIGRLGLWLDSASGLWIGLGVVGALMVMAAVMWPSRRRSTQPSQKDRIS